MQTTSDQLLTDLLAAVRPYATAPPVLDGAPWTSVRICLDPFRVDVVQLDDRGIDRAVRSFAGDLPLANLSAAAVNAAIEALPADTRAKVRALLPSQATLMLLVNLDVETVGVTLLPAAEGAEPILLAALHRPPTTH